MNQPTDIKTQMQQFGTFVFKHKCRDWADAYGQALKILGEEVKDQWTREDVIDAVMRTSTLQPAAAVKTMACFTFEAPDWLNGELPDSPEAALQRADDIARSYYAAGVQTGIHSMIEWCGVMTEYVKMLRHAAEDGHDPREVDKHHTEAIEVPDFMVDYFCEKLGCQLIPFIRGNPGMWRAAVEGWFSEAEEIQA